MIKLDNLFDDKILLAVLAIGTLIIYLIYPTPNVLYQEHDSSREVINFGKNSDCYGVKTTEVECPLNGNHKNEGVNTEKEEPHNFNMKNNQDPNPITESNNNDSNNA